MPLKGVPLKEAPPHGTVARRISRYFACDCVDCKEAHATYMREYRLRVKNNGGSPLKKKVGVRGSV